MGEHVASAKAAGMERVAKFWRPAVPGNWYKIGLTAKTANDQKTWGIELGLQSATDSSG